MLQLKPRIIFSVLLVLLVQQFSLVYAHTGGMMTGYMMQTPVSVDGTCTSAEEWNDSMGMGMGMMGGAGMMGSGDSELRVKHDHDFVYLMVEAAGDQSPSMGDMVWVAFDTAHNAGDRPGSDDYAFSMSWTSSDAYEMIMHQGNGAGWGSEMQPLNGMLGASRMSSESCPQGSGHVMYEMRVPKATLGQSVSMGMMASAFDSTSNSWMRWPEGEGLENMNQMGDLSFSDRGMGATGAAGVPISGFPLESILLALTMGLFAALLARKRRKLKQTKFYEWM